MALMNRTKCPDFTVIITTYNRPDYLELSLKSVLSQSLLPKKVLVIDDCSDAEYNLESLSENGLVEYYRLDKPSGANFARNYGLSMVETKYVAFLDDDDIWKNNFLETHADSLNLSDLVLCGYEFLNNPGKYNLFIKENIDFTKELKKGNPFCGMSGVSSRTEKMKKILFDINLPNGQDWDVYVRFAQSGFKIKYIAEPLYYYRIGSHSGITLKARNLKLSDVESRYVSAQKHRAWMGEKNYKKRIAEHTLTWMQYKTNKARWVFKSITESSLTATLSVLFEKVKKKL